MKIFYLKEIQLSEGHAEVSSDHDYVQILDITCNSYILTRKDIIEIAREMGISTDELKEGG